MKKIYTLGTDLRSEEDFMEILFAYNIRALADVRSYPKSKIPIYCKENLAPLLEREGIAYHFMGRELGGFRKGGFKAYMLTDDFNRAIDILEAMALGTTSVVLCSEKFPWKCHRRWIAWELQRREWEVDHIIEKGKLWIPK